MFQAPRLRPTKGKFIIPFPNIIPFNFEGNAEIYLCECSDVFVIGNSSETARGRLQASWLTERTNTFLNLVKSCPKLNCNHIFLIDLLTLCPNYCTQTTSAIPFPLKSSQISFWFQKVAHVLKS